MAARAVGLPVGSEPSSAQRRSARSAPSTVSGVKAVSGAASPRPERPSASISVSTMTSRWLMVPWAVTMGER